MTKFQFRRAVGAIRESWDDAARDAVSAGYAVWQDDRTQVKMMGGAEIVRLQECTDAVVEAVREDLKRRSELGIRKYGTTLAGSGLTHVQLLQHAYEEALDLANYLKAAIMESAT